MNAMSNFVDAASPEASLTIGDLAERTGVSAATLRVWETRYGFPVPHRRASGHRRYDEAHVGTIRDVVARRNHGVRLDVAIRQALAESAEPAPVKATTRPSVFATLRRTHPELTPQHLRKPTLLALSWAIEDELCARSHQAHVFGAFQKQKHFSAAEARWSDIARTTTSTFAFADFGPELATTQEPYLVPLAANHPLRREWAVVCDSPELPFALSAWELPGQPGVRERDRVFEAMWTVDPRAVREAARVCAAVAADAGVHTAQAVVAELAEPPSSMPQDLTLVTTLFNRVVAYVDRAR